MKQPTKRKTAGKPKAQLAEEGLQDEPNPMEPTMEEFVRDLHGTADVPQDGMPSIAWLKEQFETKSAMVRYLTNQKFEVRAISKHLGMRYQHVRNVANSPLKRGPNEDWRKPLLEGTQLPDSKSFKPETD